MKNEQTSKRVASIAGKVIRKTQNNRPGWQVMIATRQDGANVILKPVCTVAELQALAGSALTQAADTPKSKRLAKKS